MPGSIHYHRGDVLNPVNKSHPRVVIPHICNDANGWGRGFSGSLSRVWPNTEQAYRLEFASGTLKLGTTHFVPTSGRQWLQIRQEVAVANMVAQRGYDARTLTGNCRRPPIRYGSLAACMRQVADWALINQAVIHAPWFGTTLGGGLSPVIDHLIYELWAERGLEVHMYQYEANPRNFAVLGSEMAA